MKKSHHSFRQLSVCLSRTILLITVLSVLAPLFGQWEKNIIEKRLSQPEIPWVGDLNGDNKPDVVVDDFATNKIMWFENQLPNWSYHTIDSKLNGAYHVRVGDIDGDDTLDVVASGYSAKVVVWYENDNLTWHKHIIDNTAGYAGCVGILDVDGDDTLDVVAAIYDNTFPGRDFVWYENNHPTWTKHIIWSDFAVGDIQFGDINGDDMVDIAVSRWIDRQIVWFKNEDGGFTWTKHLIDEDVDSGSLFLADMNTDDQLDLVVPGYDDNVVVWYENNDLTWIKHTIDDSLKRAHTVIVLDLDGDEKPDVVATGKLADKVIWYKNNHPDWEPHIIDDEIEGPHRVFAADLDGDGALDLVVPSTPDGDLIWYKNPIVQIEKIAGILPSGYRLFQNYPNPFNPTTSIQFQIPNSQFTTLKVYDLLGQEVSTLLAQKLNAGNHTCTFDANNLASGIYYYQLVAGDFKQVQRMLLLR